MLFRHPIIATVTERRSPIAIFRVMLLLCGLALLFRTPVFAATDANANNVIEQFSKSWPESRLPYRNKKDPSSWKAYGMALKNLVALGDKAVPALRQGCAHKNFQVRALCARALGFLGAKEAEAELRKLLLDPKKEVALPAADALGQIQTTGALKALKAFSGKKGDLTLHVRKALERKVPIEAEARNQLLKLNAKAFGQAEIGKPAPDFTLQDTQGKTWTISQFKGKKSVVLMFLYGDG